VQRAGEGAADRLHRDVVVGGADAARGEDEGGAGEQTHEGAADVVELVGDGADLEETDASTTQHLREEVAVEIAGLAGEELVPDEKDCGGRRGEHGETRG
jgi:hypothetical protein